MFFGLPDGSSHSRTSAEARQFLYIEIIVVVVVMTPLPQDGGTARTSIQVHAVNLNKITLRERWQPISNQS